MPRGGRGGRSRSGSLPVTGHDAALGLRTLAKACYMSTKAIQKARADLLKAATGALAAGDLRQGSVHHSCRPPKREG